MVSVGKIEKTEYNGLTVDGSDVMDCRLVLTDKAEDGVGLLLSTDDGDYTFDYFGDLKPDWALESSDVLACAGLLLSFVPFNYGL